MVEKTDRPKKASGRSQAGKTAKPAAKPTAKKSARKPAAAAGKPKKTAARKREARKPEAQKPAAGKGRKRATKAAAMGAIENLAAAKEELAARRIAGGRNTEAAASSAPENQHPNEIPAPAAGTDGGTAAAPESVPSDPAPAAGQPEAASRVPESRRWGRTAPRTRAGENADGSPRPNTLVPTNGIHTTERRLKRKLHQNRGLMALVAATLIGIIILGEQTAPPNLADFEREIAASQTAEAYAGSRAASSPPGIITPKFRDESVAIPGPGADEGPEQQDKNLSDGELVEMERLLARLDLGPSTADGIVDDQTQAAIRLYQEIAGLPIDGAPSRMLLADMREVVNILEDGG